ncbi:O-acetyl-ADP-ribose deacetylase [Chryseolinea sp. H1M3-3]|uniref:O-acetyl-ADP-ribose deacetylase n=1 Tax=Chryseolinea sp. H1M3-3 TaxID=3034144 RepID=UPI0023EA935F|nr:O-acetyl-ADP-ribose deacetylase [Chryseolinea sp. H1M3-3]
MNRIGLLRADITTLEVDAIVNAANSSLTGGGGVDGAIHHAAGPKLLEECLKIKERQDGCPPGEAVITSGANLKAKFVIHAVGPIWTGGNEEEDQILANAYKNSLILAASNSVKTIAFPNISTGIFGFPKKRAAEIAFREVKDFLSNDSTIQTVIFCCYDEENYNLYNQLLSQPQ